MKRRFFVFLLIGIVLFLFSSTSYAANYFTVFQWVRNPDGSSGEATSINAYGKGTYFRYDTSDTAQSSAIAEYHIPSSPNPAYILRDVGTGWGTNPTPGERIVGIIEVPGGLRTPYPYGLNYVGASSVVYASGQTVTLPMVYVQAIPTPEMYSRSNSSITITWEGIATFEAGGALVNSVETYAIYRSTQEAGTYTFKGTARHVSGEVSYTDSGLSPLTTYWYKLRLRYEWSKGLPTPSYYETSAESLARGITTSSLAPSITSIEPVSLQNDGTRTIRIYGARLTGATNVSLTREGFADIEDNSPVNISDSQITATFTFDPVIHAIGTWDVWVTAAAGTGYGTSSQSLLTLTAEAPYIASVEPVSGQTNTTIEGFKVYGERLYQNSTVKITLGSSTISATSVTTSPGYTLLTCRLPLTNATIGTWDAMVTSMFGQVTTETQAFTVTAEAPTITSVVPTRSATGSSPRIYITGEALFTGALFELRKNSAVITAESLPSVTVEANYKRMWGTFDLTGAATGTWDVYVKNTDDKSALNAGLFTITSVPIVSSITPATRENNASADVAITGSNFFEPINRVELRLGSHAVTAESVTVPGTTQINCTLPITNATIGTWDVVVINNDGSGTLSRGFTITSEAPTFTSITPNSGPGGSTDWPVTIAGDKFYTGVTIEVRKAGSYTIIGKNVSRTDINTITCDLDLPNGTSDVGTWDVYIKNTDGKSTLEAGAFTLTYGSVATPSACTITPLSTASVRVTWTDESGNEELFRIQSRTNSTNWTTVGTAGAGAGTGTTISYTGDGTTGLFVNTQYWFRVRAEGGGQITAYDTADATYTLAAAPSPEGFSSITSTTITANWSANGNPAGTRYYCQNQNNSNNSGTIEALAWANTSLLPDVDYSYRVCAFNGNNIPTSWVSLGTQRTQEKKSVYYFAVDDVKLLSGDILGSTANISVVFSSEAGINMESFRMYIDDREVTDGTATYYDSYSTEGIFTTVNYKIKTALTEGTYTLRASATDPSGILFEDERTNLQVMSETTKLVVGYVLPYPNPYDPTKGPVKLTYRLATDTNTTIYVFDVNGRLVWKETYLSGFNGGKAGYNELLWNGYDAFSRILDNDVYLIRIVETGSGKVMGKGKIVVVKTVSSKTDKDNEQKLAAAPVDSGSGPDLFAGGKTGSFDIFKLLLLSLVGLLAFEELARMYFSIKKIGGLKR